VPTHTLDQLTQRLLDWYDHLSWAIEFGALTPAVLAELAGGEPVAPERIAARAGVPAAEVLDFLRASPAEWDADGRLVGLGLTLRPTAHRFEIHGRALYTWCAPDTLAFPVMLDATARVESPCFATGEPIRVELGPNGVRRVEPESAVVSVVTPQVGPADLRRYLCDNQHFFASPSAAAAWAAEHPDAMIVSVADGFTLTRRLLARWIASARDSVGPLEREAAQT